MCVESMLPGKHKECYTIFAIEKNNLKHFDHMHDTKRLSKWESQETRIVKDCVGQFDFSFANCKVFDFLNAGTQTSVLTGIHQTSTECPAYPKDCSNAAIDSNTGCVICLGNIKYAVGCDVIWSIHFHLSFQN